MRSFLSLPILLAASAVLAAGRPAPKTPVHPAASLSWGVLSAASNSATQAAAAPTLEGAAEGAAEIPDGARFQPQAEEREALKRPLRPMPGAGRPMNVSPFSKPTPPRAFETKSVGERDEVAAAGFWTGFNLIQFPAYLMISRENFFSPFGWVLWVALIPLALVLGLIGVAVAKIAVARATRGG